MGQNNILPKYYLHVQVNNKVSIGADLTHVIIDMHILIIAASALRDKMSNGRNPVLFHAPQPMYQVM